MSLNNNNAIGDSTSSTSGSSCLQNVKTALVEACQFESASLMNPLLLCIVSVIAVFGTVCQIIGLNFYLKVDAKGPFTTAAVEAIFWDIILFLIFGGWFLRMYMRNQQNRFDFLADLQVLLRLFVIGSLEAAGTLAVSYAARGTNESLQSLISATVVPATAFFTIFIMRFDPGVTTKFEQLKALCTWQSVSAVVLILGAVAMLAWGGENSTAGDGKNVKDSSWLPWVCFLGAIFNALHFVLQGHFMDSHTMENKSFDEVLTTTSAYYDEGLLKDRPVESHDRLLNGTGDYDSEAGNDNDHNSPPSVPIIETADDHHHGRMSSVNVVSARDNTVAGALHHHKHNQSDTFDIHNNNSSFTGPNFGGNDDDDDENEKNKNEKRSSPKNKNKSRTHHRSPISSPFAVRSDDFTVKISMLAVDTFFQIIFTFLCLPMDAIPGYGAHDTVSDSWSAFATDFAGIFHNSPSGVTGYFILLLFGWCSSHLAFAYLNHYSPTYTPMVMIVASPVTNIILLIIPKWNAHPTAPVVWASIVSAILMIVAAVLFGLFEVGRKKKKIAMQQRF